MLLPIKKQTDKEARESYIANVGRPKKDEEKSTSNLTQIEKQVAVEAKENQLSGLKQNTVSSNLKKRSAPHPKQRSLSVWKIRHGDTSGLSE